MSKSKKDLKGKGWNFAFVPKDVFLSKELDHADVRVYCYLLWRQGQNDNAWPSVETMSKDMDMSEGGVKRSLKGLVKNNWIRRERNYKGNSTTYIYEKQSDCITDHRRSVGGITGDLSVGSPDSRLNESHSNESNKHAANAANSDSLLPTKKTATVEQQKPPSTVAEHRERIAAAVTKGNQAQNTLTTALQQLTGRDYEARPNKTNAADILALRQCGATPQDLTHFGLYWADKNSWQIERNGRITPPALKDVVELWETAREWQPAAPTTPKVWRGDWNAIGQRVLPDGTIHPDDQHLIGK